MFWIILSVKRNAFLIGRFKAFVASSESQSKLRFCINRYLSKLNSVQGELLSVPCTSLAHDLSVKYLNNIIAGKCNNAAKTHKETQRILNNANDFLNNEVEALKMYKSEIFDRKENIDRLVLNVSTHPLIKKRLKDIEDLNVIDFWKKDIVKKIQYVRKKNDKLNKLEESCKRLWECNSRINSNSSVLDASKFPKVNYNNCSSHMRFTIQHLFHNLYTNGSIVFSTLLLLLYLTFAQILDTIQINIANLSDLSPCLPFIHNSFKNMRSLETLFTALNARINSMYRDERRVSQKIEDIQINFEKSTLIANHDISVQMPKIYLNFNQYVDDYLFYEKLCPTPREGKHKNLFTRYKRKYCPSNELFATPLRFDSSWSNMSKGSPFCTHSTKCEQAPSNGKLLSPVYSRLLHCSKLNQKHSKGNALCNSNCRGLNVISRKCHSINAMPNSDNKRRNLFNF